MLKKLLPALAMAASLGAIGTATEANAQSSWSFSVGTGSPGYWYDPYGGYDPYGSYYDPYGSVYDRRAWNDRQRWEQRRRWEERQRWEQRRYWQQRRWQEQHRWHHRDGDDDDD